MNVLSRSTRAWLDDFMHNATAEQIRDLLVEINDHLQSRHTWLNDAPLTELTEQIMEVEDAILDYSESAERAEEMREEARERKWEEKRDEAMVSQWEKDNG